MIEEVDLLRANQTVESCESLLKVGEECKDVIRSNEIELTDNPSDSRNVIQCDIQASWYKGAVAD